ncbi:MAG: cysteine synthase A [Muribaculaceae bacterium]|nr:cysteine synthase A [Muribaculaceae bacterium]MDE6522242.1 cysteine synthase A [Muribaculaceae bacterium]
MKIYESMQELIGNTPLLEIKNIERDEDLKARVLVKIEAFNPGGSVKDRIAKAMIDDAEESGRLRKGGTIIEPTSGNTGIGLTWIGVSKGYRVILCMPETMSEERKKMLAALGAELVLTPGKDGMKGSIAKAQELNQEIPGSIIMSQFDNPANPAIHSKTTAEEIWRDTDGTVDIFVAGVGSGGTLTGTARTLKKYNPIIKVVAVEPESSPVISGGLPGPHKIQGIGAGFIPGNFDEKLVDEVERISDKDAFECQKLLSRKEGVFAGISSGAALASALKEARKEENKGKTIVAILPDTGERYLSML